MAFKIELKEFKIEDTVEIKDKEGKLKVFPIQITSQEEKRVTEIMLQMEEVETKELIELQREFENIIFKDNIEEIKELTIGSYYDELVEAIAVDLLKKFLEKKKTSIQPLSTTLQEIGKK